MRHIQLSTVLLIFLLATVAGCNKDSSTTVPSQPSSKTTPAEPVAETPADPVFVLPSLDERDARLELELGSYPEPELILTDEFVLERLHWRDSWGNDPVRARGHLLVFNHQFNSYEEQRVSVELRGLISCEGVDHYGELVVSSRRKGVLLTLSTQEPACHGGEAPPIEVNPDLRRLN